MRLTRLYRVPQGAQVVIQDLGQLGVRKSPDNLDPQVMVELELDRTMTYPSRSVSMYGNQNVFVDDSTQLIV
jgi:hypothetical protein